MQTYHIYVYTYRLYNHRLKMELLQTSKVYLGSMCTAVNSLAQRPHNPPSPPHLGSEGTIGQPRQNTSLCDPLCTVFTVIFEWTAFNILIPLFDSMTESRVSGTMEVTNNLLGSDCTIQGTERGTLHRNLYVKSILDLQHTRGIIEACFIFPNMYPNSYNLCK